MKISRSKHFSAFVKSELAFLKKTERALQKVAESEVGHVAEVRKELHERVEQLNQIILPKSKRKCRQCDFRVVKGLNYKRKDGQEVTRLKCSNCGKTESQNKLPRFEINGYKEIVFIVFLLEGMRVTDLLKLFPKEEKNLYYWWSKCQSKKLKDLFFLKSDIENGVNYFVKHLFNRGNEYTFGFADQPGTDTDMHIRIDTTRAPVIESEPNQIKKIRAAQFLLLGVPFDDVRNNLMFETDEELILIQNLRIAELQPLSRPQFKTPVVPDGKRPILYRNWERPSNFWLTVTTEPNSFEKPLIIRGRYSKNMAKTQAAKL